MKTNFSFVKFIAFTSLSIFAKADDVAPSEFSTQVSVARVVTFETSDFSLSPERKVIRLDRNTASPFQTPTAAVAAINTNVQRETEISDMQSSIQHHISKNLKSVVQLEDGGVLIAIGNAVVAVGEPIPKLDVGKQQKDALGNVQFDPNKNDLIFDGLQGNTLRIRIVGKTEAVQVPINPFFLK